jgi:RNA polymerase sigma-70 factor (TIGR02943 family)
MPKKIIPPAPQSTAFAFALAEHRSYLLRYARRQLPNEHWAEDVVSETLLAALAKPSNFENRSQLKTWLVAILKHKIIDHINRQSRFASPPAANGAMGGPGADGAEMDWLEHLLNESATNEQKSRHDPYKLLEQRRFFEALDACIALMPPHLSQVFWLRECLGLSSPEICTELDLSPTNLYIQLHRARVRLRSCLNTAWLDVPPTSTATPAAPDYDQPLTT